MFHRESNLQENGAILEDEAENERSDDMEKPASVVKQPSSGLLTREELDNLELEERKAKGKELESKPSIEVPPSPGRVRSRSANDIFAPSPRPPVRSNSHSNDTSTSKEETSTPLLGLPPTADKKPEGRSRKLLLMKSRSSGQWLAAAAKIRKKKNSGIREHKDENESNPQAIPTSKSLADVAKKVVASRRAANSFKAMWPKDHPTNGNYTTIHGLHLEKKKLDLRILNAQYKEVKRSEFYEELVVYCVFLLLFFELLSCLPFHGSFEQSDVTVDLTCSVPEVCTVESPEGIYDFAKHLQQRICNAPPAASPTTFQTWTRVGGVQFRQIRVKPERCLLSFIHDEKQTCYPEYSDDVEEKSALLGANRTYVWHNDFVPLVPGQNSWMASTTGSYGTGGYSVNLCDVDDIEELQADSWIDLATRAASIEFVVVNPSTRVFTIASHEFVIRPSGHLEQYSQSANIRVLGLEQPPASIASWWSWCQARYLLLIAVVGFVATYLRGEVSEIVKMGITSYLTLDGWNLFEMAQLMAVCCTVFHIYIYFSQCRTTIYAIHGYDDEGDTIDIHQAMLQLLDTFLALSDYASLSTAFSLLKVFKFLRMNSTLNLLWQVLGMALRDLMGYLVIFQLIFLSYSTMGSYAFGFDLEEFSTIWQSYGTCFHMLAGDFPYDRLQQANPRLAPFFFVTFVVLVLQIMVNMFVAILSEYYDNAKDVGNDEDDVEYDIITRVKEFMSSCSPTVELKNNECIVLRPSQTVRLISTNLVDKELTRQRAKKLFRGAVWRVVALLRFGVKFDARLDFDRPKPTNDTPSELNRVTYIPLSENFDHATIKMLLPKGITICLTGDAILGQDLLLRVLDHNSLSVECVVLSNDDDEDDVMELSGGEKLRLPIRLFAIHVLRILFSELRAAILRATKWWDPYEAHLVDDYHLYQLLKDERERGKTTLRFDELSRLLDLYLRKEKRGGEFDQNQVKRETALVMYRFRNSLIDMPSREKEGHEYVPNPIDTSMVELGPNLLALGEAMAENVHDIWAIERIDQGWSWGPRRDDNLKTHPNLIPYAEMSEEEQSYDVRTSMETIKTIIAMKYTIVRALKWTRSLMHSSSNLSNSSNDNRSIIPSSPKATGATLVKSFSLRDVTHSIKYGTEGKVYTPRPVDTSQVVFPQGLKRLMDLLAENAHEVWSKGRMDEGWTYGQQRNDKLKKHVCLVPYVFLTDAEKDYDIKTAEATLKMLYALGYHIVDSNGVALS
ncbi:ryanodine-inositol 1,4,5-triphosphate receptor Ca2 channel (RIR-CaC) family protein [Thraustotheca clavata]|uniref:Ryanodine-inositol 1,4,5-triphosphate receptor Ca2 channel (RIR-CaC) family protein n=1 Tax=Thraustotheca clavata TaxID=74557 RepID=A0A1W0A651_9STRA|nr:ryanodine-inositol 1,4,5-triphosphate receptor Ca2 channel (RIR-CaC) family protein [Thraustotheca clavata]